LLKRSDMLVLGFVPDCIRRGQQHSGENGIILIGYVIAGIIVSLLAISAARLGKLPAYCPYH
jgi:hypothetical protein